MEGFKKVIAIYINAWSKKCLSENRLIFYNIMSEAISIGSQSRKRKIEKPVKDML